MTDESKYRRAATQLLEQAHQELASGDVRQASEKGWGAAAQAVKAVAERRGWRHRDHPSLFSAVRRLARETRNNDLDTLFHRANGLHGNFYENTLPANVVSEGLEDVAEFIAILAEME